MSLAISDQACQARECRHRVPRPGEGERQPVAIRVSQRALAIAVAVWCNKKTSQPVARSPNAHHDGQGIRLRR